MDIQKLEADIKRAEEEDDIRFEISTKEARLMLDIVKGAKEVIDYDPPDFPDYMPTFNKLENAFEALRHYEPHHESRQMQIGRYGFVKMKEGKFAGEIGYYMEDVEDDAEGQKRAHVALLDDSKVIVTRIDNLEWVENQEELARKYETHHHTEEDAEEVAAGPADGSNVVELNDGAHTPTLILSQALAKANTLDCVAIAFRTKDGFLGSSISNMAAEDLAILVKKLDLRLFNLLSTASVK